MANEYAKLQKSVDIGVSFAAIDPFGQAANIPWYPSVGWHGVRCGLQDDDNVYWFGQFAFINGVTHYCLRQSINAGMGWIPPALPTGTVNTETLAPLRINPDNDNRVIVHNRDDDDLHRSINGCVIGGWTVLDAGMDFDPADLEMDQDNPQSVFITGNRAAAAVLVQRTMNEAAAWQDLTGNLATDTGDAVTRIVKPRRI